MQEQKVAHLKQSLEGRMLRGILDEGEGEERDELLLVAERRPLAVQKLLDFVQALCRRRQADADLSATRVWEAWIVQIVQHKFEI